MQQLKRRWPQKRWKKILLITLLTLIITSISLLAYINVGMNNDVITEVVIKNPQGNKTALILYHPGLSAFSHDVAYAFAEGLISNGWRVEITTPSIQAPTELSNYSILVVLSNTYAWSPDMPTSRHLERIGNLNQIQTVLITLGAGSAQEARQAIEDKIETSNGKIIDSMLLYSMAPNEGNKNAVEIAKEAARQIG
ncbi:MAG: hypothetical protein IAX22_02710 [Candidatus Bathyarchaeota archaeon]|nr:hypothetical protein [Candidatus Bathyarchaeota archaeon]